MSNESSNSSNTQAGSSGGFAAVSEALAAPGPHMPPIKVGMMMLILSESVFFMSLLVTYSFYLGKSNTGPTPKEVLDLPPIIRNSVFLLSSSGTIYWALRALKKGNKRQFYLGMWITIILAVFFLWGTGQEWWDLIVDKGLLPATNIFGSSFYTLVGFHALHVTVGVIAMLIIIGATVRGHITKEHSIGAEVVSWYWHMVDTVWVFIFILVYIIGRK